MRRPAAWTILVTVAMSAMVMVHAAQPPRYPINQETGNPFGLMIGGAKRMSLEQRIALCQSLGASYFRPNSLSVEGWRGLCPECEAATKAGLRLVLSIRNSGGRGQPSSPPTDLEAYQHTVGNILDRYRPAVVVVENEENSKLFYAGSPQAYHQQLRAACEAAHARRLACTNGGLVSTLVALLVADDYAQQGQADRADRYRRRTLDPKHYRLYRRKPSAPRIAGQVAKGKALLAGYRAAGADYVNFHWYIADTDALAEAVEYLSRVTGLPALTNEVGQQENEDPAQVTAVMEKILALKLPIAVWFSLDVPGYAHARSLVNEDGTLRDNGRAFQAFIETRLPSR